jgi:hypothetical protein
LIDPSGPPSRPGGRGGTGRARPVRVVDPRLLRHATAARAYLLAAIALRLAAVALILVAVLARVAAAGLSG